MPKQLMQWQPILAQLMEWKLLAKTANLLFPAYSKRFQNKDYVPSVKDFLTSLPIRASHSVW